jgi:gluconate kinase
MEKRKNHFMPEELLHSQFATLEKPSYAYSFSIEKDPASIVNEIIKKLQNHS